LTSVKKVQQTRRKNCISAFRIKSKNRIVLMQLK